MDNGVSLDMCDGMGLTLTKPDHCDIDNDADLSGCSLLYC